MDGIHSYLSAGLAVILGAVAAGTYTAYLSHLSTKNENIKDYLNDLDEIEQLCRNYWLFDGGSEECRARHDAISHELRAKLEATSSYDELSRSILGSRYQHFTKLDLELFMVATGGTFQTKKFAVSPEVYSQVMKITTEMRGLLRKQRISLFWAK
ncbi:MAG: hypothetical protein GY706_10720 [Bacteroides sp.]|nr:hypothetical protein [Bacteroides sp.]